MRVIKGRDMKKTIIAAMFTLLASATTAQAVDIEPYVGIGVGGYLLKTTTATVGTKTAFGGYGQLGADIGDYFGAELRLGASGKATLTSPQLGGVNINSSIDYIFSYLGKLQVPVSENFRLYGLLGGTTAQVASKIKTPGVVFAATGTTNISARKNGFSFGGGLDFKVQDKLIIGAEYMHYYKEIIGFSANIKYLF